MARQQSTSKKNEVRLAVMSEKINNIEASISDMKDSIKDINSKMDYTYATKKELKTVEDNARETEKKLDSTINWVARLIIGAVILAVLGLVINNQL